MMFKLFDHLWDFIKNKKIVFDFSSFQKTQKRKLVNRVESEYIFNLTSRTLQIKLTFNFGKNSPVSVEDFKINDFKK